MRIVPCVTTTLPSKVLVRFTSSPSRRSAPTTISFSRSARSAPQGIAASAIAAAVQRKIARISALRLEYGANPVHLQGARAVVDLEAFGNRTRGALFHPHLARGARDALVGKHQQFVGHEARGLRLVVAVACDDDIALDQHALAALLELAVVRGDGHLGLARLEGFDGDPVQERGVVVGVMYHLPR